jgi:phthalate 4,5-dioxygenase oxygenase subunit
MFPQAFVIPMSSEMTISQWHMPVDDTHCYWYAIFTSFTGPVDKQQMRDQRLATPMTADYTSRKNKRNDYGYDPHEQEHATYTGMGDDINVHDQWAVESQGPIQDRTREHLGSTDKGIIAYRRLLVRAIESTQAGEGAPMLIGQQASATGPAIDRRHERRRRPAPRRTGSSADRDAASSRLGRCAPGRRLSTHTHELS